MDILSNMSGLQLSLVIIGAVVIVGVVIFNWIQQQRYQRKIYPKELNPFLTNPPFQILTWRHTHNRMLIIHILAKQTIGKIPRYHHRLP